MQSQFCVCVCVFVSLSRHFAACPILAGSGRRSLPTALPQPGALASRSRRSIIFFIVTQTDHPAIITTTTTPTRRMALCVHGVFRGRE